MTSSLALLLSTGIRLVPCEANATNRPSPDSDGCVDGRSLSPPDVLACVPGERWAEEVGLNDHHYIVPGAGGLGEIMNNSFV